MLSFLFGARKKGGNDAKAVRTSVPTTSKPEPNFPSNESAESEEEGEDDAALFRETVKKIKKRNDKNNNKT